MSMKPEKGQLPTFRCDECDNGVEPEWEFCAWCGVRAHWNPRNPTDDAEFGMTP